MRTLCLYFFKLNNFIFFTIKNYSLKSNAETSINVHGEIPKDFNSMNFLLKGGLWTKAE